MPKARKRLSSDDKRPSIEITRTVTPQKSEKMLRIEQAIRETANLQALRLLNRCWWREYFLLYFVISLVDTN